MYQIGIIGCGQISKVRHAPEYSKNPHCHLKAFYDGDTARAEAMAKLYGGTAYKSLEELLACGLDAVSICVPNRLHCSYTVAALRAGCHVLCEKPMATNPEECRSMVEAAEEAGKVLMIGHNQRYTPTHQKARELIAEGRIGRVLSFRTTFGHGGPESWCGQQNPWFYDRSQARFGAMADLGIHKVDLIRYLTGQEITHVTAATATLDKTYADSTPVDVDDNAFFILRLASGAVGTVHASWTFYGGEDNSTVLYGSEGSLHLYEDPAHSLVVHQKDGGVSRWDLDDIATNEGQKNGNSASVGIIDAFIRSIDTGEPSVSSGKEILRSMEAVFAADQAAREGRTLALQVG
ncbi:MAG: Gfo/Idh/MocA family oxidoreductase [Oscillospiraceae bacterium]|nr:Gfo/Idh/MocA family oxidoreductase [Oscillospiraceae bacterium]